MMKRSLNFARKVEGRARQAFYGSNGVLRRYLHPTSLPKLRLGTQYGGWSLVDHPSLAGASIISCGAGEDISFDILLEERYGARVIIVDPTPRAISHVNACLAGGKTNAVLEPVAAWNKSCDLTFWGPYDQAHVSHSVVNLQKTSRSIQVKAVTLDVIAARNNVAISDIPLVKLDIEGAEVEVIAWMMENDFRPAQLLVELDELLFPDRSARKRAIATVELLIRSGYVLIDIEGIANALFVRPHLLG